MTRTRNDTPGAGAAETVTTTSKKKSISGSDATRLHRCVFTECHDDLVRNLDLSRDKSEFFKKPKPALKIDNEISWLLNHNDQELPQISRSTVVKKLIGCPYHSVRKNIIWAISMAEDALGLVVKEEEKYKKAEILLKDLSDMEILWQKISKINPYDLTPYRPKFMSDHSWDLTGVFNSFDALNLAMGSIDEIKSKAESLVNERKNTYQNGGNPGKVWEKAFAKHIALCWCSLTGEQLHENKHIKYLERFISMAFESIYQSFEESSDRYDKEGIDRYANYNLQAPGKSWAEHARSASKHVAEWSAHLREQAALPDDGRAPTYVRIFNTPLGRPGFASQGAVRADARARDALAIFDAAGTAEEKSRAAFDFLVSFSVDLLSEEGQKTADNIRSGFFFGHFFYILETLKDNEMS